MNPIILASNLYTSGNSTITTTGATLDDSTAYYNGLEFNATTFTTTALTSTIVCATTENADCFYIKGDLSNVTNLALSNAEETLFTQVADNTWFIEFTPKTSGSTNQFTLTFTVGTIGHTYSINNLYLGEKLELSGLYAGFTPVYANDGYKARTNISKNGKLLGKRYTTEARQFNLEIKNLKEWFTTNRLMPFLDDARAYSFIFAQNKADIDTFMYCWLDSSTFPKYQDTLYQAINLKVKVGAK